MNKLPSIIKNVESEKMKIKIEVDETIENDEIIIRCKELNNQVKTLKPR